MRRRAKQRRTGFSSEETDHVHYFDVLGGSVALLIGVRVVWLAIGRSPLWDTTTVVVVCIFATTLLALIVSRSRAYTQTVVDTIAAGLLSIDRHGRITTFNPSAERILGIWGDRVGNRPANEMFKEFKLDLFQTAYDRMLADKEKEVMEV